MKLSIIVPCYNEEFRFEKSYRELSSYLENLNIDYEIVAVNDGSKDKTEELIKRLSAVDNKLKLVSYYPNKGKGAAVKNGILNSEGDVIAFIDADIAFELKAIEKSVKILEDGYSDIVIANRRMKGSEEHGAFFRRIFSLGCRFAVLLVLRLTYADTQSGFKAFKKDVAYCLANNQKIEDFSFDVEYLYVAKKKNYRVTQIPVKCINDVKNSSVHIIRDSIRFCKNLFAIRFR